jgi:hypothetical protein
MVIVVYILTSAGTKFTNKKLIRYGIPVYTFPFQALGVYEITTVALTDISTQFEVFYFFVKFQQKGGYMQPEAICQHAPYTLFVCRTVISVNNCQILLSLGTVRSSTVRVKFETSGSHGGEYED